MKTRRIPVRELMGLFDALEDQIQMRRILGEIRKRNQKAILRAIEESKQKHGWVPRSLADARPDAEMLLDPKRIEADAARFCRINYARRMRGERGRPRPNHPLAAQLQQTVVHAAQ